MRTFCLAVAFSLGCVASVFADVRADIVGPSEARVGDLVVLSGKDSVGDGFRWMQPAKVQTISCGDGMELAFATGTPGVYSFTLIAADTEAAIDYVTHTVTITGTLPDQPDEPDEPDQPDEPTPGEFGDVVELSRQRSVALNDATTRNALAVAITATGEQIGKACDQGQCPGTNEAKRRMVAAIESTLLNRRGSSQQVDWTGGWRVPINEILVAKSLTTVPRYLAAMRAVALGLTK